MDVSQENAEQSLALVEGTITQTRKSIHCSYTSPILMLWGAIWVVGFLADHWYLGWTYYTGWILNAVGIAGTISISRSWPIKESAETPLSQRFGWRVFALWISLFVYGFIWLNLLAPFSGLQLNAFMTTAVMFVYVVMGLWFAMYFIIWLGLSVTAITLVGFYLIPSDYYSLWMAVMAGGALLGTGIYIRVRWR